MNYVLITGEDYQAFAERPHGLMEFGFEVPQLYTIVLPRLINLPILRTFLAPLYAGMQAGLSMVAFLNGAMLTHQLVECHSGFYLRVVWGGAAYLMEQIEQIASTQVLQLHQPSMIFANALLRRRRTTVYIPGGNTLIMSRKFTIYGHESDREIDHEVRRRFPDLTQVNFGIGPVHSSYFLMEPTLRPGWTVQLVLPILEDDATPVVLFQAVLPPYEGIGAIYAPTLINKHILILDTGLDIVCGPQGELCACYHNGRALTDASTNVADFDYLSCWLNDMESEARSTTDVTRTCDRGGSQLSMGNAARARS